MSLRVREHAEYDPGEIEAAEDVLNELFFGGDVGGGERVLNDNRRRRCSPGVVCID
jgi:hypothetical protein